MMRWLESNSYLSCKYWRLRLLMDEYSPDRVMIIWSQHSCTAASVHDEVRNKTVQEVKLGPSYSKSRVEVTCTCNNARKYQSNCQQAVNFSWLVCSSYSQYLLIYRGVRSEKKFINLFVAPLLCLSQWVLASFTALNTCPWKWLTTWQNTTKLRHGGPELAKTCQCWNGVTQRAAQTFVTRQASKLHGDYF